MDQWPGWRLPMFRTGFIGWISFKHRRFTYLHERKFIRIQHFLIFDHETIEIRDNGKEPSTFFPHQVD